MSGFQHISPAQTHEKMNAESPLAVVDIRDYQSYINGHMPDAAHLTNDNLSSFISQTEKTTPVIVVCYHGNSSQQAASYLAQQGFAEVYSMDLGFEGWRHNFPVVTGE
ncbi:thiosulfate sulfurtransferase GlpE [Alteromonas facilis]|uniref:thiosulfate sulfurtransferase GlpE n=1 Tax=Alteromonas facilis TaxID=2048004 RepID=UPI000C291698|nr:thiosulfate sulfurtransferase GlpE [Alteromonas facilis]